MTMENIQIYPSEATMLLSVAKDNDVSVADVIEVLCDSSLFKIMDEQEWKFK